MFSYISKILDKLKNLLTGREKAFLCDTCKYDYPAACRNAKRPNVKECGEYRSRTT